MHPVTVREATTADLDILAANNRAMAMETEEKQLDAATVRCGTRAVLENPARGFYLLAQRGNRIAGQLLITREWSDWRNGDFWWIQSVYVLPQDRNQGVFRTLFEKVQTLAHEDEQVCGFRLYMDRSNNHARTVYQSLGFLPTSYDLLEMIG